MKRAQMSPATYTNVFESNLVDKLEDYVNQQLKENTFDMEANLHLLRLYQIFHDKSSVEGVRKVLLKALMNLKDNAFTLAMYLVPEKYHNDSQVEALSQLAKLLEVAQYDEFWKQAETHKDTVQAATGFNHAVRDFILDILLITYRTVDMPFLVEALNLKETELKTYLQMKGMKLEGGYVQFPENQFTALKPRVMPQNIQFDQIAKIF
jgi:translation initiation factor 3 subunit K